MVHRFSEDPFPELTEARTRARHRQRTTSAVMLSICVAAMIAAVLAVYGVTALAGFVGRQLGSEMDRDVRTLYASSNRAPSTR